jgi:hypothetical protein
MTKRKKNTEASSSDSQTNHSSSDSQDPQEEKDSPPPKLRKVHTGVFGGLGSLRNKTTSADLPTPISMFTQEEAAESGVRELGLTNTDSGTQGAQPSNSTINPKATPLTQNELSK